MEAESSHNLLRQRQKKNLTRTMSKNCQAERLVKSVCKFAKLITKTSSKV